MADDVDRAHTSAEPKMRRVELPAGRPGYRPMPLALMDQMSVCERCWSVVCRFHQELHDEWHVLMAMHHHPPGCQCGTCP